MTVLHGELERLHVPVAEELHLIVPVSDGLLPVNVRQPDRLPVDEEVLTHCEPLHSSALRAVVSKLALVSVSLGQPGQLRVPELTLTQSRQHFTNTSFYSPSASCWPQEAEARAVLSSPSPRLSWPSPCCGSGGSPPSPRT